MKKANNERRMDILARITLLAAVFLFTGCGLGTMQDVANTQTVLEQAQSAKSVEKKKKNLASTHYPYGPGLKMSCVKEALTCWLSGSESEFYNCAAAMDHSDAAGWTFAGTRAVTSSGTRMLGTSSTENEDGTWNHEMEIQLLTHLGGNNPELDASTQLTSGGIVGHWFYVPVADYEEHGWENSNLWATSCVTYVPGPNTQ